jgi:hypothetical protein
VSTTASRIAEWFMLPFSTILTVGWKSLQLLQEVV